MANRAYGQFGGFGAQPEDHARWVRMNKMYTQALPFMLDCCLLPGRAGVSWSDGETQVIWTFAEIPAPAGAVIAQLDGERVMARENLAILPAWGVYRLTGVPMMV